MSSFRVDVLAAVAATLSRKVLLISLVSIPLLGACSHRPRLEITSQPSQSAREPIRSIALAPSGGPLADAIGFGLMKEGIEVTDSEQVSRIMMRLNLNEVEVWEPKNLQRFKAEGVETLLQVRSVGGYDSRPQSATIKLISTETSRVLIGATWQNGRSGATGSIADSVARVDIAEAAEQIAQGLSQAMLTGTTGTKAPK